MVGGGVECQSGPARSAYICQRRPYGVFGIIVVPYGSTYQTSEGVLGPDINSLPAHRTDQVRYVDPQGEVPVRQMEAS